MIYLDVLEARVLQFPSFPLPPGLRICWICWICGTAGLRGCGICWIRAGLRVSARARQLAGTRGRGSCGTGAGLLINVQPLRFQHNRPFPRAGGPACRRAGMRGASTAGTGPAVSVWTG